MYPQGAHCPGACSRYLPLQEVESVTGASYVINIGVL